MTLRTISQPCTMLPRRSFLQTAAVSLPFLCASGSQAAADEPRAAGTFPGVITRQSQPRNVEFPFATLDSFLTPNEQFYIRTHFNVPQLDANQWRLKIEGHVQHPFEIDYQQLTSMEAESLTSVLECSGNSRVFLEPPQTSIRWEQGGVGNAQWTGVRLSSLLERAGIQRGAVEVILEGHDKGKFETPHPETPGEIHYARSLPLEKALQPEILLAYKMNGQPLPADHGFPVRAIVAGWYGMASVKWLRRIVVTDQPFHGYFQTFAYSFWQRRHSGMPTLAPVTEIRLKSQIARPMLQEVIAAGTRYRVYGAAWSGALGIKAVDFSSDGGKSWSAAALDQQSEPYAWRLFHYDWHVPEQPGKYTLMVRATDTRDQRQPLDRNDDYRDAMIHHVQPIEVEVRSQAG